jgi:hypothetical protein
MADYIEVPKDTAKEYFPNFCVYWEEPNNETMQARCWWHEVNGRYHQFPEGEGFVYYLKSNVYANTRPI